MDIQWTASIHITYVVTWAHEEELFYSAVFWTKDSQLAVDICIPPFMTWTPKEEFSLSLVYWTMDSQWAANTHITQ